MAQNLEERSGTGKRKRIRDDSCYSCCQFFDSDFDAETNSCVIDYFGPCASIEDSDDSVVISPAAKRIREKLFGIFDEVDDSDIQDLESVIKSFEQEILCASSVVSDADASSFCETSLQELGYLLEASDDELGLPPSLHSVDERNAICSDPEVINEYCSEFVSDVLEFDDNTERYDFSDTEFAPDFHCVGDSDSIVQQSILRVEGDSITSHHVVSPSSPPDCLSVFRSL